MKPSAQLKADEFQLLNEFICENFGISFPDHKMSIIESKLRNRLTELNMSSFMDYYLYLQFNFINEKKYLTNLITNHETYFFRETYQLDALMRGGLDILKDRPAMDGMLRFLCAGCSTGEEPYTLNIYLKENQFSMFGLKTEIDAFDLDSECLATAREGKYTQNSMRGLEEEQIGRYFIRRDSHYFLKPMYKDSVRFKEGNITDISTYRQVVAYDAVFCRNVLIYFNELSIRKAVDNFAGVLKPEGLLFLGHSESIIGLSDKFETIKLGSCIVYQKVTK